MLSSDTDILLNCLTSPYIALNHVGVPHNIDIKFTNWALLGTTESNCEPLNDVVLTNFYNKFVNVVQHVNINYMQNLASNVFDQLFDFAENFIVEADQLIKIDVSDDLLS